MLRHSNRETVLAHVITALGIAIVALTLSSGPLGQAPEPALARQVTLEPLAHADSLAYEPTLADQSSGREGTALSSRGDRQLSSASGSAGLEASPSTTASPAPSDTPTSTPRPSATATLTPQPTATATRTASPTATAAAIGAAATPSEPWARVGIQAGHWRNSELPGELASLRGSTGAAGSGWREVDVNLDVARRVVALLERENVLVDLIPATVPVDYKADAFVSLHGDANSNTRVSGFKAARYASSSIPQTDDVLLNDIIAEYGAATGLPEHRGTITPAMRYYYAFNQSLQHSVAPTTPSIILEMVFLTTPSDLRFILDGPDRVADGVARGVLKFLRR